MTEAMKHRIAAYCYAETVLNTEYGTWGISIKDVKSAFDIENITFEEYEEIVETIYNDYEMQVLDVNENRENEAYFAEGEFNLNIGTYFYMDVWGEEESEEE